MGGRTNNAGDWLSGRSQGDFDNRTARRKASAELLRKSGYTKGIDEATGEEYDFRARLQEQGGSQGQEAAQWGDEQWKGFGESYIANVDKDPFGMPRAGAPDKPLGPPPKAPDLTDQAIQKARTSALWRLQSGKNRESSFATKGALGGFDVAKPVLGGY